VVDYGVQHDLGLRGMLDLGTRMHDARAVELCVAQQRTLALLV
jgi:hypothetical protein